jgi:toxin CcdB
MSRYDLYTLSGNEGFVLDVQSDLLSDIDTRVVVPLLPVGEAPPVAARLNPVFTVEGRDHVMVTQALAAVPGGELSTPCGNLSSHFDQITRALDMLFHGF